MTGFPRERAGRTAFPGLSAGRSRGPDDTLTAWVAGGQASHPDGRAQVERLNPIPPTLSVLVVDDDPVSVRILADILQGEGFAVRTTSSSLAALRGLQECPPEECPPDLLLTDLRMPEMNGLDLIRAARRAWPDLCCLLISAFLTDDTVAEAFRAGVHDLLQKPINLGEVRARALHAAEVVLLRREVLHLRALTAVAPPGESARVMPSRANELANLPSLPGSAAPLEHGRRYEVTYRLERIAALHRQGLITQGEFDEKKRALLHRI